MRFKIYATALAVGFAIHATSLDWSNFPPVEEWRVPWTPNPDVVTALEVRCADELQRGDDSCATDLSQRFASGELEPLAVIRSHCTRWQGPWESAEEPPRLCQERFGGWIRG